MNSQKFEGKCLFLTLFMGAQNLNSWISITVIYILICRNYSNDLQTTYGNTFTVMIFGREWTLSFRVMLCLLYHSFSFTFAETSKQFASYVKTFTLMFWSLLRNDSEAGIKFTCLSFLVFLVEGYITHLLDFRKRLRITFLCFLDSCIFVQ